MQILNYIKLPKRFRAVDSKVAGGSYVLSPFKMCKLKESGFTDIVDLRRESRIKKFIEKLECKIFNINYTNIKISLDDDVLSMDFYKGVNNLLKKNRKTYIHCRFGSHRTGLCLAAYEKMLTSRKDKEILERLNKFWDKHEHLKTYYDDFMILFHSKM